MKATKATEKLSAEEIGALSVKEIEAQLREWGVVGLLPAQGFWTEQYLAGRALYVVARWVDEGKVVLKSRFTGVQLAEWIRQRGHGRRFYRVSKASKKCLVWYYHASAYLLEEARVPEEGSPRRKSVSTRASLVAPDPLRAPVVEDAAEKREEAFEGVFGRGWRSPEALEAGGSYWHMLWEVWGWQRTAVSELKQLWRGVQELKVAHERVKKMRGYMETGKKVRGPEGEPYNVTPEDVRRAEELVLFQVENLSLPGMPTEGRIRTTLGVVFDRR